MIARGELVTFGGVAVRGCLVAPRRSGTSPGQLAAVLHGARSDRSWGPRVEVEGFDPVAVERGGLLGDARRALMRLGRVEVRLFGVEIASGGITAGLVARVGGVALGIRGPVVGSHGKLVKRGQPGRFLVHTDDHALRERRAASAVSPLACQ